MTPGKKQRWLTTWVPHRLEMLLSPAWQAVPRPLHKLIERLEIEHLRHGGFENGHLFVSYQQFVDYGISKRSIRPTLALGEALKLIKVDRVEEVGGGNLRPPNRYGLTFTPLKGKREPGDEWRQVSKQQAETALEAYRQATAPGSAACSDADQTARRNAA